MTISISLEVDTAADAAYIRLSQGAVARTVEVNSDVLIDLDEMNVVVGVEVLSNDAPIPFSELTDRFHVHSSVVDLLRRIRPTVGAFASLKSGAEGSTDGAVVRQGDFVSA